MKGGHSYTSCSVDNLDEGKGGIDKKRGFEESLAVEANSKVASAINLAASYD